ncbi:MAG: dihydroorotase [Clostridiales bacterium]|nr:dihydroorotase [Clostridiales bacterium]
MGARVYAGGQVYRNGRLDELDICVEDGIITAIGKDLPGEDRVDCTGKIITPGFIDLHVHLREPGYEKKETIASGTALAKKSGFQTVCAMPNLNPAPDAPETADVELAAIRRSAEIDTRIYGTITRERAGKELSDIEGLAPFVCGYTDDGSGIQSEALMEEAMLAIKKTGHFLAAHVEDMALVPKGGCIREGIASEKFGVVGIPPESETQQLLRDLKLVEKTGVRYHMCHISAKESVEAIREAKQKGLPVTCEVTPHQLCLCDEDITEDNGRFKMNPPLGTQEDRRALIIGVLDGTIDVIATDHAPHTPEEKGRGLALSAFGVSGFATAFAASISVLPITVVLQKMIDAPARILGMGDVTLREGMKACFNILHMNPWTVCSEGRSTPFEGMTLTGGCECRIEN